MPREIHFQDNPVLYQPVFRRGRHQRIPEDPLPVREPQVARLDRPPALVLTRPAGVGEASRSSEPWGEVRILGGAHRRRRIRRRVPRVWWQHATLPRSQSRFESWWEHWGAGPRAAAGRPGGRGPLQSSEGGVEFRARHSAVLPEMRDGGSVPRAEQRFAPRDGSQQAGQPEDYRPGWLRRPPHAEAFTSPNLKGRMSWWRST